MIKYNSVWIDNGTGKEVTIGQGYMQGGVQYYFVNLGMKRSSKLLPETTIRNLATIKGETK